MASSLSRRYGCVVEHHRRYSPATDPTARSTSRAIGHRFPATYLCDRGTMLPAVRVQLSKGEELPKVEGLGEHTRWRETNIQG